VLVHSPNRRYGEFVCEVDGADGTNSTLALKPKTATEFTILDPHKPRPAGTTTGKPGWITRIIGISREKREIELQDEADWKLAGVPATWRTGDRVTVEPGSFYSVVNVTRGESRTGSFIGFGSFVPGAGSNAAEPSAAPGPVAAKIVQEGLTGHYSAEWDALHPAFKAIVDRARFAACEHQGSKLLGKLKIKSVEPEPGPPVGKGTVPIVGATRYLALVTVSITYTPAGRAQDQLARLQIPLIPFDGKWVRALGQADVDAYKAGRCP
jgi:hypothetical protein